MMRSCLIEIPGGALLPDYVGSNALVRRRHVGIMVDSVVQYQIPEFQMVHDFSFVRASFTAASLSISLFGKDSSIFTQRSLRDRRSIY